MKNRKKITPVAQLTKLLQTHDEADFFIFST